MMEFKEGDMGLDGKAATVAVKRYFEETHGSFMVWDFRVEKVEYDEAKATWFVVCSFAPYMSGTTRLQYEVSISDEGAVMSAKKLE